MGHRDCRCLAPEEQKPTNQTNKTPKYEVFNKILNPHSSSLLKKKKVTKICRQKEENACVCVFLCCVDATEESKDLTAFIENEPTG